MSTDVQKQPFTIGVAILRIRKAVQPFPTAALFELADEGYTSVFEQLVACIISIRTLDEVTIICARQLFQLGRTPEQLAAQSPASINDAIGASTFHEAKARQIHEIARHVTGDYGGVLPCEAEVLMSFYGVGSKCTNLVLGIACGQAAIAVDTHVHRVTNRWGYIRAKSPEQSMRALEQTLPRKYWVEINRLLVPFGKHVCTARLPKCSTCPVLSMCRQVAVIKHR